MSDTIPQNASEDKNYSPLQPSVYALSDPRTNEIRYIGSSTNVYGRYAQHVYAYQSSANPVKRGWIKELLDLDMMPTLTIIESNTDEGLIKERENYWIQHCLSEGASLINCVGVPRFYPSKGDPLSWWAKLGYPRFEEGEDGFPRIGQVVKYYRERSSNYKVRMQKHLAKELGLTLQRIRDIENRDADLNMARRRDLVQLLHIPPFLLSISMVEDIKGWMSSPYKTLLEYELATYPPLVS